MNLGKTISAPQRELGVSQKKNLEFRLHKGEFVGLVESSGARHRFLVRDLRRERPTIQGTEPDFHSAVNAVKQLLNALADPTSV